MKTPVNKIERGQIVECMYESIECISVKATRSEEKSGFQSLLIMQLCGHSRGNRSLVVYHGFQCNFSPMQAWSYKLERRLCKTFGRL